MNKNFAAFVIICIAFVFSGNISFETADTFSVDEMECTVPELIQKSKYDSETHYVVTSDGYILKIHRIIKSPLATSCDEKQPILLVHGLTHSSAVWVLMRPLKGLGYLLADECYDVWLGNTRGNRYGRNHTYLSPDDNSESRKKFWNFSWHEMGIYDLPAMIDHILETTVQQKVHFIGHSQGATAFVVMCAEHPKYNEKIVQANLLAPVYLNPFVQYSSPIVSYLMLLDDSFGIYEIPSNHLYGKLAKIFCYDHFTQKYVCGKIVSFFGNSQSEQMNQTMLPVIMGHIAAGFSTKQLIHYLQLARVDRFQQFDYGENENLFRYGNGNPPEYNLNNVKAKISLRYAQNDGVISAENVEKLISTLPNVISTQIVQYDRFDYRDYLFSKDVRELLYDAIIADFKQSDFAANLDDNSLYYRNFP